MMMPPFALQKWINENRHLLKPPVGNKLIWEDREFMVFIVGGPNQRTDFHQNQSEEFFYQIEGNMNLRILENGKPKDWPICEGEIFLLPPGVPHSPQRPANTVGMVIEHKRPLDLKDKLIWICDKCFEVRYQEEFYLKNIVTDFKPVFDRYHGSAENFNCKKCGHYHTA